jgi:acetyl esterase/lipase
MYLCTPAADLTEAGDTMVSNASRGVLPTSFLWSMALQNYPPEGGIDDRDPQYSPVYYKGYDTKFPRTVITPGTRDIMLSSATRLYWVLREAGVEVELLVGEGMWHGYNWDPFMPEALQTRKAVLEFLEHRDYHNKT